MRTCLSCRARLREFRATPERVAALVPPAALVAADGGGPLRSLVESVAGLGDRFHAAAELATGQKIAAVAASAAALAGGGTAIDEFANHQGPPLPEPVQQVDADGGADRRGAWGPATRTRAAPASAAPADAAPAPRRHPPPNRRPRHPIPRTNSTRRGRRNPPRRRLRPPRLRRRAIPHAGGGGSGGGSAGGSGEFAP